MVSICKAHLSPIFLRNTATTDQLAFQGFVFVSIVGWNQSGHFSTIGPLVSTGVKERKICRILFASNWAAGDLQKKTVQFSPAEGFNQQKLPTVSKIKGMSSNAHWSMINDDHHPIMLVFLVLAPGLNLSWQRWEHHLSARSQFLTWLSAECQKAPLIV